MTRSFLITLPALMMLAACNSPGDGTSQSETETVPGGDGTVAAPTDMSEPAAGTEDGTMTDPNPDTMTGSDGDTAAPSAESSTGPMAGSASETNKTSETPPPPQ